MHPGDQAVIRQLEAYVGIPFPHGDDFDFQRSKRGYSLNEAGRVTKLTLMRCLLEDISPLASLTALTHLRLTDNLIQDISPLASLTALTQLYLYKNQIQDVSPLVPLTALTLLDLGHNLIHDLSPLATLTALARLYLHKNQIQDVSPLATLTPLSWLNLNNNEIQDISPLSSLTALIRLYLGDNQIQDVSPLATLTALIRLEIYGNQIQDISPLAGLLANFEYLLSIGVFTSASCIVLRDNPIQTPPPEILEQGIVATQSWLAAWQSNKKSQLNQVKVLLIGSGGAGKTSLAQRIRHNTFDPHQSQTHGISIETWRTPGPCAEDMQVHFWDFGGQEIMHATHQFFLTRRSLYVVVQSAREDDRTRYWLRHIQTFAGDDVPVLVVINKIDEHPSFSLDEPQLKRDFPNIIGFYPLSCKTGDQLTSFTDALCSALADVDMVRASWPGRWFTVKQKLEALSDHYITVSRFRKICEEAGIKDTTQRETLLRYLHDLGVVLWFPSLHMRHMQVLNPEWATGGVYKIINAHQLADSQGRLNYHHLDTILNEDPKQPALYPDHTHAYLVELMQRFEICYPLEGQEAVLFPDLLPKRSPEDLGLDDEVLDFLVNYSFLPPSVMPRLMVRLHRDISHAWRNGVIFQDANLPGRAVVQVDRDAALIRIQVSGPKRRDIFAVVLYFLRTINDTYPGLHVKELVPLPGNPDPRLAMNYEQLSKSAERGIEELPGADGEFYKVKDLLGGVREINLKDEAAVVDRLETLTGRIESKLDADKKVDPIDAATTIFDLNSPWAFVNVNGLAKITLKALRERFGNKSS